MKYLLQAGRVMEEEKRHINEKCGTNFKYYDLYPSYIFNATIKYPDIAESYFANAYANVDYQGRKDKE